MTAEEYQEQRQQMVEQIDTIDRDKSRDVESRRADILDLYASIFALDAAQTI
jgi:hypothetical protein